MGVGGKRNTGNLQSSISSSQSITPSGNYKKTLSGQNTQIGFWGGYVQINNEVFKVDYCAAGSGCSGIHFSDFDTFRGSVFMECMDGLSLFDCSRKNSSNGHSSYIVIPFNIRDKHTEVSHFNNWTRNPLYNRFKKCRHIFPWAVYFFISETIFGRSIQERGIELVVVRFKV